MAIFNSKLLVYQRVTTFGHGVIARMFLEKNRTH